MPLLGNLLTCFNFPKPFDLECSKVAQDQQQVYRGECCSFLVCINDITFELFPQLCPVPHFHFQSRVHTTCTQHILNHCLFILSIAALPFKFIWLIKISALWTARPSGAAVSMLQSLYWLVPDGLISRVMCRDNQHHCRGCGFRGECRCWQGGCWQWGSCWQRGWWQQGCLWWGYYWQWWLQLQWWRGRSGLTQSGGHAWDHDSETGESWLILHCMLMLGTSLTPCKFHGNIRPKWGGFPGIFSRLQGDTACSMCYSELTPIFILLIIWLSLKIMQIIVLKFW